MVPESTFCDHHPNPNPLVGDTYYSEWTGPRRLKILKKYSEIESYFRNSSKKGHLVYLCYAKPKLTPEFLGSDLAHRRPGETLGVLDDWAWWHKSGEISSQGPHPNPNPNPNPKSPNFKSLTLTLTPVVALDLIN